MTIAALIIGIVALAVSAVALAVSIRRYRNLKKQLEKLELILEWMQDTGFML